MHIHKHALKFWIFFIYFFRNHVFIHTHTLSKDEPRLVRASYWAVLSDYLCMANPPDTPWEVIIHKRGCSHRTVTFHNACLSVIFWIKMYNSYWLVICFLQAISIPQTMFWKLTFLQLSVPFARSMVMPLSDQKYMFFLFILPTSFYNTCANMTARPLEKPKPIFYSHNWHNYLSILIILPFSHKNT